MLTVNTCLGVCCRIYIRILNKFVERFVFSIDCRIASVMAMILVFSYTADFMQSFSESLNMQNMDIRAEMRKFIKMFHR